VATKWYYMLRRHVYQLVAVATKWYCVAIKWYFSLFVLQVCF